MSSDRVEKTRTKILEAARKLLEAGGAASMADIAAEAGVTRQLLYVRFDDRADLLLELSRRIDAEVRTPRLQETIDRALDGRGALRATVEVQAAIKEALSGVATAIDRLRATDEDASAAWDERESARLDRCRRVIERLVEDGDLAEVWDEDAAARLLWSTTSQHAWSDLVTDRRWTTDQWATETTRLLECALLA